MKRIFNCVFDFLDKGLSTLYKERSAVNFDEQVLIAFRFYTTGSFQGYQTRI